MPYSGRSAHVELYTPINPGETKASPYPATPSGGILVGDQLFWTTSLRVARGDWTGGNATLQVPPGWTPAYSLLSTAIAIAGTQRQLITYMRVADGTSLDLPRIAFTRPVTGDSDDSDTVNLYCAGVLWVMRGATYEYSVAHERELGGGVAGATLTSPASSTIAEPSLMVSAAFNRTESAAPPRPTIAVANGFTALWSVMPADLTGALILPFAAVYQSVPAGVRAWPQWNVLQDGISEEHAHGFWFHEHIPVDGGWRRGSRVWQTSESIWS